MAVFKHAIINAFSFRDDLCKNGVVAGSKPALFEGGFGIRPYEIPLRKRH